MWILGTQPRVPGRAASEVLLHTEPSLQPQAAISFMLVSLSALRTCARVRAHVHMCAHMQGHTWMSEDNLGVHSLLPLCGSRRLNSHPQAWWPAPPHAEPPHHRPPISVLHKYFISLRGKYKSLLSSHSILPWHLQLYCREAFRIKMNSVSFLG